MSSSALIIGTRNRPEALRNTLASLARQHLSPPPLTILIDASNEAGLQCNRKTVDDFTAGPVVHQMYDGVPSAARQRNRGLRLLPADTEFVFFLDDDITLLPNCLSALADALHAQPELCGVGAIEVKNKEAGKPSRKTRTFWKYLFLLDHPQPGRVLLSGHISRYDRLDPMTPPAATQWLSTCCCAYRRSIFHTVQFDEAIPGALLEDRDLSYRVSRTGRLAALPAARFLHHRSPIHRRSAFQFAYERSVQRYWFVEKNMRHPLRKLAFWWATIGQLLAALTSTKDSKWMALRGHVKGIRAILTRDHPLLHGL